MLLIYNTKVSNTELILMELTVQVHYTCNIDQNVKSYELYPVLCRIENEGVISWRIRKSKGDYI